MRLLLTVGLVVGVGFVSALQVRAEEGKLLPGVVVSVYDVGEEMRQVPRIVRGQQPNVVHVVETIDLRRPGEDFGGLRDAFVTRVDGYLTVSSDAEYRFRLISDDGSKLWIGGTLVIDHDGAHGPVPKEGRVYLKGGVHRLRIEHFEAGGGQQLTLQWLVAGARGREEYLDVPAEALWHSGEMVVETSPGKKKVVGHLRRTRPGDMRPLDAMHPSWSEDMVTSQAYAPVMVEGLQRCGLPPREKPEPPLVWIVPDADEQQALSPLCTLFLGPYEGHGAVVNAYTGRFRRVFTEVVDGTKQGCVFRFSAGHPIGSDVLMVNRDGGEMLVGQLLGLYSVEVPVPPGRAPEQWLTPAGGVPFEMLAVRVMRNGVEIEFTKALDRRVGWESGSYHVEQWPFDVDEGVLPTPTGEAMEVKSASVSEDRRRVFLEIEGLRGKAVLYLRLLPPCVSESGELPWTTEAWYTVLRLPVKRAGVVRTPPKRGPVNVLTEAEQAAGWRLLFDGKSGAGWRGYRKTAFPEKGWAIEDGCLVRVGPGGDLITDEEFEDFELSLEWRISSGGNSGVFYRVAEEAGPPWETGPEMQVLDNGLHADGANPLTSAGSNYALHAPGKDVTEPVGLFNRARVVVRGDAVEHWLNGEQVVSYTLGSADWEKRVRESKFAAWPAYGTISRGHIVLQDHGDKVWYRNIKIRRLGDEEGGSTPAVGR